MITQASKSRLRSLKAFTLSEVVMSILIINIGAAGLMGCFKYAYFVTGLAPVSYTHLTLPTNREV